MRFYRVRDFLTDYGRVYATAVFHSRTYNYHRLYFPCFYQFICCCMYINFKHYIFNHPFFGVKSITQEVNRDDYRLWVNTLSIDISFSRMLLYKSTFSTFNLIIVLIKTYFFRNYRECLFPQVHLRFLDNQPIIHISLMFKSSAGSIFSKPENSTNIRHFLCQRSFCLSVRSSLGLFSFSIISESVSLV